MEDKDREYKTISGVGLVDFMAKCREAQKEGWILVGNPMVSTNIMNQVMVKYSKKKVNH